MVSLANKHYIFKSITSKQIESSRYALQYWKAMLLGYKIDNKSEPMKDHFLLMESKMFNPTQWPSKLQKSGWANAPKIHPLLLPVQSKLWQLSFVVMIYEAKFDHFFSFFSFFFSNYVLRHLKSFLCLKNL